MMTGYVNPLKRSLTKRMSQLMPKMPSPMRSKPKQSPKTRLPEEEERRHQADVATNNIEQRVSNFLAPPEHNSMSTRQARSRTTILQQKKVQQFNTQGNTQNSQNENEMFSRATGTENSQPAQTNGTN